MNVEFRFLKVANIPEILPLMQDFTQHKYTDETHEQRFNSMFQHEYDCVGFYIKNKLIGLCGLWYQTRHYSGKSCELDHLYIIPEYQGKGLGTQFLNWIENKLSAQGYEALELNAYKENTASHRLYAREGFLHLGFHFVKRFGE
jgi:GNAT superfamily N-acetyltransferase